MEATEQQHKTDRILMAEERKRFLGSINTLRKCLFLKKSPFPPKMELCCFKRVAMKK